jgi:hypothetical protein
MKNMKLWKTILIAISVAILPLALVGVGQAQQLTCWGLRPNLTERTKHTDFPEQLSSQEREDAPERKSGTVHHAEDENDAENIGFS